MVGKNIFLALMMAFLLVIPFVSAASVNIYANTYNTQTTAVVTATATYASWIRIYEDGVEKAYKSCSSSSCSLTKTFYHAVPGTHSYYAKAGSLTSNTIYITYSGSNIPPWVSSISVSPSSPVTTDSLNCYATLNDNEQTSLTANWVWYRNGAIYSSGTKTVTAGQNTLISTIPSTATSKGQSWYCSVTPNDGSLNGNPANSNTVTIANSPPTAPTSITVSPTDAYKVSTLTAIASGATDPDGDSLTYQYEFRNAATGAVLQAWSSTNTFSCQTNAGCNKNQDIRVAARAWDGSAYSAEISIVKDILNSAPTVPTSLTVTPDPPYITAEFTATASGATDVDGDSLTYQYRFFNVNDNVILQDWSADNSYVIQASDARDVIRVYARAFDGSVSGPEIWIERQVQNGPPQLITNIPDQSWQEDRDLLAAFDLDNYFMDPDGDPLTYTVDASGAPNITVQINPNNTVNFIPDPNFNGVQTVVFIASDGIASTNSNTVTLTVTPVNDAPTTTGIPDQTIAEDSGTTSIDISPYFNDVDGDTLTFSIIAENASQVDCNIAGNNLEMTPAPNWNGLTTCTVRADDGNGGTVDAIVNINVTAVNDAPIANDDSYSVDEDNPLTIPTPGVLANDSDIENDPLTAILVTDVTNGNLTLNADGSFTYMPNTDFFGTDSFTYVANDGIVDSNIATVTITVNPVNDAPIANDDSYTIDEDTVLTIPASGILSNDIDVDSNPLIAILITDVTNGNLTLNANGSFTYTPNLNFNGIDSFTYVANDGIVDSNIATVTITVNPVNDAPVWSTPIPDQVVDEDFGNAVVVPDLNALVTDPDGDPLSFSIVAENTSEVDCEIIGSQLEINSVLNWNGLASCTVRVDDGNGGTADDTFTITVNPVNDAPIALNDSYTIDEDTTLNVVAPGILGNDVDADGDNLTTILITDVSNGNLTLNADGSFIYMPNANFYGTDSFTYVANDGFENSSIATVTITVNPINDAPIANDDSATTNEDESILIDVLANDTDVEDGTPSLDSITIAPTNGIATIQAGQINYTPNANFFGTDTFTYQVIDSGGLTDTAVVTVNVTPVNDAPTTTGIPNQTLAEDTNSTIDISPYFNDVDGDTLAFSIMAENVSEIDCNIVNGTYLEMIPALNWNGLTTCTVQASDGNGGVVDAIVNINVTPVNDAPVANDDNYVTDEDVPLTTPAPGILANDSDIENDPLTAILITDVTNGTLTLNPDGSFTYTPNANFNGTDSFTYHVNDGQNDSNIATVTITVNPVPDYSVSITSDSYYKEVGLLQPATYLINVTNTGDTADSYTLSVNNISGADHADLNETAINNLAPSQSYIVSLTVNDSNPGIYNVTVTASGQASNTTPIITTNVTTTDSGWIFETSWIDGQNYTDQSTGIFPNINDTFIRMSNITNTNITGNPGNAGRANITNSTLNIVTINVTVGTLKIENSSLCNVVIKDNGNSSKVITIYNQVKTCAYPLTIGSFVENNTGDFGGEISYSNVTNNYLEGLIYITNYSSVNNSKIIWSNISNSTVFDSTIRNSTVNDSTVTDNSVIDNSTITGGSEITNSSLTNSTTDNSTITNSTLDSSNVTGSQVTNSTLTNSTVDNSTITNSTLDGSTVTDSNLTNVNATNSTIDHTTLENATLIDANLTDGVLYNGTIITDNFTYNATGNNPLNLSNTSEWPAVVLNFTPSTNTTTSVTFTATISGQWGTILSYTWEFGDGNTIITTVNTISHTYTTAKNYTAKVTVTDNFGSSASDTVDLTVTTAPTGGGVPPGGPYYPYGGLALLPAAPETNDYTIDLAAGVETLQLKVGDTVTITFEGGSYYSTVDSITDRITFGGVLAGSYSQYDVIKKDLNRDGKTDLVAIVNNIVNGSAFVTFMAAEKYEVAAPAPSPIVNVSLGPVCGNGVCEAGEDSTSCPADCPAPPTGLLGLTGAFLTSPAGIAGIGGFVLGVAVIGSIAEWRKRHALAIQRAKHIEVIQKLKRKVKK